MNICDGQSDWDAFVESAPWFARGEGGTAKLTPLPNRVLATEAAELFPKLNFLLTSASVVEVALCGERYELFGWKSVSGGRLGWLCGPPPDMPSPRLHAPHRVLLRSFGGILERFNEPEDTWLLNLDDALTERAAASSDPDAYVAVFDGPVPTHTEPYYPIAIEANGNTTLCDRESGSILLFAPDHSFDHVTVLIRLPRLHVLYDQRREQFPRVGRDDCATMVAVFGSRGANLVGCNLLIQIESVTSSIVLAKLKFDRVDNFFCFSWISRFFSYAGTVNPRCQMRRAQKIFFISASKIESAAR